MTVMLLSANVLLLLVAFVVLFAFFRRRAVPAPSQPAAETFEAQETTRQLQWPVLQRALEQLAALEISVNALTTQLEQDRDSWKSTAAALSTRIQRAREPREHKPKEMTEEQQLEAMKMHALQQLTIPLSGDSAQQNIPEPTQWLGGTPTPLVPTTAQRFQRRGA